MSNFNEFAKNYDNSLNEILNSKVNIDSEYFAEYKIKEVYSQLKYLIKPKKILDFGCGIGKNSIYLSKYFNESEIYGIDVSSDSIEIANARNLNNCHFEVYDGENIKFENNLFDLIFISNVFHHIEHKKHLKILKKLKKKLSKNGFIFMFEHNTLNPVTLNIVNECEFDKDAKLLHYWYAKKIFADAGFKNIYLNFIFFIPPSLSKLLFLENYLKWLPLGGQYYIFGTK